MNMKQHLLRDHLWPEYYCDPCRSAIGDSDRQFLCPNCSNPTYEFITEPQLGQLRQFRGKSRSVTEQCHALWEIVFGDGARPESIYAEGIRTESLALVRELVDTSGPRVIETVMRGQYPVLATASDAAGLFRRTLDAFEDSEDASSNSAFELEMGGGSQEENPSGFESGDGVDQLDV
ncbi:hypothetical protein PG997_009243 [Apiospora hydei]|uniref:Uncharacterized protein n=1 Tax=Apiospora hydei TaxID=1337664 RepID=A0ABR1VTJ6_9PEZI